MKICVQKPRVLIFTNPWYSRLRNKRCLQLVAQDGWSDCRADVAVPSLPKDSLSHDVLILSNHLRCRNENF